MMSRNEKQLSKFLSLVLRHKPETIGILLDQSGWTDVETLIQKSNSFGVSLDISMLKYIVMSDNKKRYSFNEKGDKIRASQGHSIALELGYKAQNPPEILYHGTSVKSVESILNTGIEKRSRSHVHLSYDIQTAINVGSRHGKPAVFLVQAKRMFMYKFEFFLSDNGVWLTNYVPAEFIKLIEIG